jgi:hypothetical protein
MSRRDGDTSIYGNDRIQVHLALPGQTEALRFTMNCIGLKDGPKGVEWSGAARDGRQEWFLEFLIPLAALGTSQETPGALALDVFRQRKVRPREWTMWSYCNYENILKGESLGRLILAPAPK